MRPQHTARPRTLAPHAAKTENGGVTSTGSHFQKNNVVDMSSPAACSCVCPNSVRHCMASSCDVQALLHVSRASLSRFSRKNLVRSRESLVSMCRRDFIMMQELAVAVPAHKDALEASPAHRHAACKEVP